MALTIADVGKGAQKSAPDKRDFKVAFDAVIQPPIDWATGSQLPRPALVDQGGSDCCVACAWSYYHWQLRGQQFSRVDLFARIALPAPQGAQIKTGGLAIVNQGQATEADSPDPVPEANDTMRNKAAILSADELPWKEYNSFGLKALDIESMARAISMYRGVVCGFYGTNTEWSEASVPEPPTAEQIADLDNLLSINVIFGHALYLVDFHMHTNPDGKQEECVIGMTSWPNSLGITEHHMRARYFNPPGAVYDCWTLIPTPAVESVMNRVTLKIPGRKPLVRRNSK
jgi:hypothetical protein